EQNLMGSVTFEEMDSMIRSLNDDSSPGYDGLTYAIYKVIWKLYPRILIDLFNEILVKNEKPKSFNECIFSLVHKKNEKSNLENWRPISLINCDKRLFSKLI
ncbi:hypothetical protein ROZALSC1DRAFT_1550, partial [Rozella allomycis CSF55]